VSHVLDLFKNLKTKKKGMKKVLKLQLQNLSHIVYFPFLVGTFYKQRVWSSNFTLENVCTWDEPLKRLNPKQINK